MSKKKNRSSDPKTVPPKHRGPDRRAAEPQASEPVPSVNVDQDARGNTVLNVTTVMPMRRADDDTVNIQELLEVEELSVDNDDDRGEVGSDERSDSGNPKQ